MPEKNRRTLFGGRLHRRHRGGGCHGDSGGKHGGDPGRGNGPRILMVGNPNVGKSAIFNRLTSSYAVVSNYPGTTVALTTGRMKIAGKDYSVVDTPGMYSLYPITEEERVGRRMLLEGRYEVVLHIVDAKNLTRMLPFTMQLKEAGVPVILVLNIMDEAEETGLVINVEALEKRLEIPVIPTVGIAGKGVRRLKEAIKNYHHGNRNFHVDFSLAVEMASMEIAPLLPQTSLSRRALSLLALQEDRDVLELISSLPEGEAERITGVIDALKRELDHPINYDITLGLRRRTSQILEGIIQKGEGKTRIARDRSEEHTSELQSH